MVAKGSRLGRNGDGISASGSGVDTLSMKKAIDATMKKMENPGGSSN
jgi:hypothetical protein